MVNVNEFLNVIISSFTLGVSSFLLADIICIKKKGYALFFDIIFLMSFFSDLCYPNAGYARKWSVISGQYWIFLFLKLHVCANHHSRTDIRFSAIRL